MIRLTMLPGEDGDCLLLEYGDGSFTRRVLIDGGRAGSYPRIRPVLTRLGGLVDVVVVTHVDQDHILGVLAMLADPDRPVELGDVWFNGYDELLDSGLEKMGPQDGEMLTTALVEQHIPWNVAFAGRSVEIGRPLSWFDDGSALTVLSPDRAQLARLAPVWVAECARNGLIPGRAAEPPVPGLERFGPLDVDELAATPFAPDSSMTNATSIAFLFEFEGMRLVLPGDADDRRLVSSLRDRAVAEGGRLRVDALKVAHHGSAHNLSVELLSMLDCPRYLISTSGARHGHPDDVAMARILKHGGPTKQIVFNYRDPSALWDVDPLKERYGYDVVAPDPASDGAVTVELGT